MPLLRLQYERMKRRWPQAEVARRSAVSQPEVSAIERGRLIPTEEQLLRLANALHLSPPEVLLKPTILKDEAEAVALVKAREADALDVEETARV